MITVTPQTVGVSLIQDSRFKDSTIQRFNDSRSQISNLNQIHVKRCGLRRAWRRDGAYLTNMREGIVIAIGHLKYELNPRIDARITHKSNLEIVLVAQINEEIKIGHTSG